MSGFPSVTTAAVPVPAALPPAVPGADDPLAPLCLLVSAAVPAPRDPSVAPARPDIHHHFAGLPDPRDTDRSVQLTLRTRRRGGRSGPGGDRATQRGAG